MDISFYVLSLILFCLQHDVCSPAQCEQQEHKQLHARVDVRKQAVYRVALTIVLLMRDYY